MLEIYNTPLGGTYIVEFQTLALIQRPRTRVTRVPVHVEIELT